MIDIDMHICDRRHLSNHVHGNKQMQYRMKFTLHDT